jgi:hypothetical protein
VSADCTNCGHSSHAHDGGNCDLGGACLLDCECPGFRDELISRAELDALQAQVASLLRERDAARAELAEARRALAAFQDGDFTALQTAIQERGRIPSLGELARQIREDVLAGPNAVVPRCGYCGGPPAARTCPRCSRSSGGNL